MIDEMDLLSGLKTVEPVRPHAFLPSRTARASEPSASSGGIRTSTKALPPVNSPTFWGFSTARWRRSRPTWARLGARP